MEYIYLKGFINCSMVTPFSILFSFLPDPGFGKYPAIVGFGQSRSKKWIKNAIHSFRDVQVKKNDLRSRSRNESEIKMTGNWDREVKVKWKSFEIEIEKWNFSRIFKKFWEILENQEIKKISNFVTNAFHLANFYSGIQQNAISESICHRGFWGWSLVETCKAVWMDWVGNLWMHLCWRRTRMADIDSDLLTIK